MGKKIKNESEEIKAENTPKVKDELTEIQNKYNNLIAEIKPKLMTNAQLKRGGGQTRARYEKEQGFLAVLPEINALGKKLGLPPIGLGHLRG